MSAQETAEQIAEEWELALGEPYPPGADGVVLRAELADGTPVVLKLSHRHRENEQEAEALERWNGNGAVRLLRRDDEREAVVRGRRRPAACRWGMAYGIEKRGERLP